MPVAFFYISAGFALIQSIVLRLYLILFAGDFSDYNAEKKIRIIGFSKDQTKS